MVHSAARRMAWRSFRWSGSQAPRTLRFGAFEKRNASGTGRVALALRDFAPESISPGMIASGHPPGDRRFVWIMLTAAAAGAATTVAFVLLHEDLSVAVPSEAIGGVGPYARAHTAAKGQQPAELLGSYGEAVGDAAGAGRLAAMEARTRSRRMARSSSVQPETEMGGRYFKRISPGRIHSWCLGRMRSAP